MSDRSCQCALCTDELPQDFVEKILDADTDVGTTMSMNEFRLWLEEIERSILDQNTLDD